MTSKDDVTGLILAGGRGSRMGGVDKGLQNHLGIPLAMHALLRLAPQVGHVLINANRNLGAYDAMGVLCAAINKAGSTDPDDYPVAAPQP